MLLIMKTRSDSILSSKPHSRMINQFFHWIENNRICQEFPFTLVLIFSAILFSVPWAKNTSKIYKS